MKPVTPIFRIDLANWMKPSMPNRRPRPFMMSSLLKSGFSFSGVSMKPVWATLAITPPIDDTSMTSTSGGNAAMVARFMTIIAPPLDRSVVPAWAMNGTRAEARSRVIQLPAIRITETAPASEASCGMSADLTTSPLARASDSFLADGSSVFDSGSVSSAMARS
jgi:hypothetical protein